jgi:trehalose utilization protein
MRAILMLLLLGTALWRAGVDWQGTISRGYAFRPGTVGDVFLAHWPGYYRQLVESLLESGVPYAWNPVGAFVMSLPVALTLATLALALWLTREPRRGR